MPLNANDMDGFVSDKSAKTQRNKKDMRSRSAVYNNLHFRKGLRDRLVKVFFTLCGVNIVRKGTN